MMAPAQMEIIGRWAAMVALLLVCMGGSFLYSGLETGVYMLNRIRLDLRAEAGQRSARRLRRLLSRHTNFLAVLLIGNNLANYALSFTISTLFVLAGMEARAEWYTLAVATPLLFILCEGVPKNVFQRSAETLVYRFSTLLWASSKLFNVIGMAPLVRGFSAMMTWLAGQRGGHYSPMAHESVATAVAEGHAAGALTHFQSIMADRVMHLGDLTLRDVSKPLGEAVTIATDASRDDVIELLRQHDYARLPVLAEDGRVVGVLDVYDLLAAEPDKPMDEFILPPLVLRGDGGIVESLYRMRRGRAAMAIVADRRGRHVGLATLKDLVEEIVGELEAW
jgi:CBS domain containing-hemolysin-like protein